MMEDYNGQNKKVISTEEAFNLVKQYGLCKEIKEAGEKVPKEGIFNLKQTYEAYIEVIRRRCTKIIREYQNELVQGEKSNTKFEKEINDYTAIIEAFEAAINRDYNYA